LKLVAERRDYYVVYAALPDDRVEAAADLGLETDERGKELMAAREVDE